MSITLLMLSHILMRLIRNFTDFLLITNKNYLQNCLYVKFQTIGSLSIVQYQKKVWNSELDSRLPIRFEVKVKKNP